MNCNLCQQSNYVSLHGRMLCGNCGNQAGERLAQFQSRPANNQPEKIYSENTLDLSHKLKPNNTTLENTPAMASGSLDLRATVSAPVAPPTPISATRPDPTHMQPQATYPLKSNVDEPVSQAITPPTRELTKKRFTSIFKRRNKQSSGAGNMAWMRLATVTAGMLLLVGYVTYLNYPNIAVRVAASRANIDASMPGYLPQDYSFSGPVVYNTGKLTLTFSGAEGTIALSQSNTRWDSESLLDNHVRQQTSKYSTYQENGLTIYTYDNRFAAWVNAGVLYQIEASDFLSPDDIVKMASSL